MRGRKGNDQADGTYKNILLKILDVKVFYFNFLGGINQTSCLVMEYVVHGSYMLVNYQHNTIYNKL